MNKFFPRKNGIEMKVKYIKASINIDSKEMILSTNNLKIIAKKNNNTSW